VILHFGRFSFIILVWCLYSKLNFGHFFYKMLPFNLLRFA